MSSIIQIICFIALACVCIFVPIFVKEMNRANEARQRRLFFVPYKNFSKNPNKKNDNYLEKRRKLINSKLKSIASERKHSKSSLGKFIPLLEKAGIKMRFSVFCLLCLFFALITYLIINSMGYHYLAVPGFFAFLLFGPMFFLKKKIERRQRKFTKFFGTALETMVRGLRAGMPPQECFRLIGNEVPEPCGEIFRQIMADVQMGIPLSDSIANAYEKMPTTELKFFNCVISIQQQTGGNLSEILGNIAEVIRGRAALKEKAKALSSEARMSSMIIGALPFIVCGALCFTDYGYISLLWTTFTGKIVLFTATCSMAMGLFVMNKMSKIDS